MRVWYGLLAIDWTLPERIRLMQVLAERARTGVIPRQNHVTEQTRKRMSEAKLHGPKTQR